MGNAQHGGVLVLDAQVHPHARGERAALKGVAAYGAGSSPRPWGTPRARRAERAGRRFIPTPVGNAGHLAQLVPHGTVHPHARGERHAVAAPHAGGVRFIPTPVGNALRLAGAHAAPPVHPHARGERAKSGGVASRSAGSSPRPWGTPPGTRGRPALWRFIPTPVGNAATGMLNVPVMAVHPHARGERPGVDRPRRIKLRFIPTPVGNASCSACTASKRAVHPHARGERGGTLCGCGGGNRFIPTPVGNATGQASAPGSTSVHPHARGERSRAAALALRCAGSSPRPWGTPADAPCKLQIRRFIPTPVGNALGQPAPRAGLSVHPHARGERVSRTRLTTVAPGSSPRPWGTPSPLRPAGGRPRFIPTPVGNAGRAWFGAPGTSVHPHARGERQPVKPAVQLPDGSSPRPWGTRGIAP